MGLPGLAQLNGLAQAGLIEYDPSSVGQPLSLLGFKGCFIYGGTDWKNTLPQYLDSNPSLTSVAQVKVFSYNPDIKTVLVVCNSNTDYVKMPNVEQSQWLRSLGLMELN
jgi:hypothetical protein